MFKRESSRFCPKSLNFSIQPNSIELVKFKCSTDSPDKPSVKIRQIKDMSEQRKMKKNHRFMKILQSKLNHEMIKVTQGRVLSSEPIAHNTTISESTRNEHQGDVGQGTSILGPSFNNLFDSPIQKTLLGSNQTLLKKRTPFRQAISLQRAALSP